MPRPPTDDIGALIAVYVLHGRPEAGAAREHALQHLIEVTIFEEGGELEASDLAGSIRELVQLSGDPPSEAVLEAVKGCKERGCLEERAGRYVLAEHRRQAISRARDAYAADEAHFDGQLVRAVSEAVGDAVPILAEPMLVSGVKGAIAEMLVNTVIEVEGLVSRGCQLSEMLAPGSQHDPVGALKPLAETLANYGFGSSESTVSGIRRFLGDLDQECQRYLTALHHKALIRQILNFDPHLYEIQKQALRQTRVYLDTNVVIAYILEEHDEHGATTDVLDASLQLGIQLFVSPATVAELERQLQAADLNRQTVGDARMEAIVAVGRHGLGSYPFLGAYLRRRRERPGLTWDGFAAPYGNMEEYLLSKHILVEAEEFEGVESEPCYWDVWNELRRIKLWMAKWMARVESRFLDRVVDHDTQNFVLIHKLREKHGPTLLFGPSVWLLTRDSNLAVLDQNLARRFDAPHSCQRDDWARLLLPFENIMDFAFSDYIAHLVQSRLGVEPQEDSLDLEFLASIRRPEFDLDRLCTLPPEVAHAALVDMQSKHAARQLAEKLRESPDPSERAAAGTELSGLAAAAVADVRQRELAERDRRVRILEEQNRQMQELLRGVVKRSLLQRLKEVFFPRRLDLS